MQPFRAAKRVPELSVTMTTENKPPPVTTRAQPGFGAVNAATDCQEDTAKLCSLSVAY